MMIDLSRREWLAVMPAVLGAAAAAGTTLARPAQAADDRSDSPFGYCFNTSTIQGQKLPLEEVVAIVAKSGYQGIEPWIRDIETYVKAGGSLRDLGTRIRDLGLSVESAIGFFEWAVDDDARRKKAFDIARQNMEM